MKSLNNLGVTIPGGFRWKCPDTGQWVPPRGHLVGYTDFIHECKKHCLANNVPIGLQWEQQVQDQLCVGLDGEWCSEGGFPVAPAGGWDFSVASVVQGSHRLAQKMIQAKARRVPVEVSTQRAAICIDCPFNQGPEGCTSCNQTAIENSANLVAGSVPTVHDARLRSCKVSGLSLKAKINVPLEILLETLTEAQKNALPQLCWLK